MAAMLDDRLKALGFKTERRKASAGPRADLVIGMLAGGGTKKIMLQAHMDTVYERSILQSQLVKLDGNKLCGPGIADDKGGIAVILNPAVRLANARKRFTRNSTANSASRR
jgi:glutamate carboxypeptidase